MALIARFIGIDRYVDPDISELAGAARDARALCALFADTLTGIDAKLLVDDAATAGAIRQAIAESLRSAGPEDDVIFFFAGHGSPDHRLAAHDTRVAILNLSTVAMSELADAFHASRARSIICILDCCFSGAAPARVLEAVPPASSVTIDAKGFTGPGRVLVTAARWDEASAEHPTRRHGLLTDALIQVLSRGPEPVDLLAAMGEVCDMVRAEAAALGHIQTPVVYGFIQGGFKTPPLIRGARFEAAFPDLAWVRIGTALEELAAYRLPIEAVREWSARYPEGLLPLQLAAINDRGVLAGRSALIIAPTSAGKTFVGEVAAVRASTEGRKAVFLVPFKALANEKYDDFRALYATRLGMRVIRCTGDFTDERRAFLKGRFDLAVLTYEAFLGLAVAHPAVLHRLGLVVLDEAQFIADPGRGIVVELILTYLRTARERGIAPQLLALSATIGDLNHFDEWLGIAALVCTTRPVPLEMGVLDRSGTFEYLDPDGRRQVRALLPRGAVRQRGDKPSSQDVIVPLVRDVLADQAARETVLIFREKRGEAEGCANYLADEMALPAATATVEALSPHDRSTASAKLRRALSGGVAFHNSNLTRDERVLVEAAFRDAGGPVRVLTATTTVAAGINTPASTVIIAGASRRGMALPVAEVKNMAGRAGRLGQRAAGRAIILADTPLERRAFFDRYVAGEPEPICSSFADEQLGTWVLRLLAQMRRIGRTEIPRLLANTYGGYLAARNQPGWQRAVEAEFAVLVARMLADGLLEQVKEEILLTPLGQACGASSLGLDSGLGLVEMLRVPSEPITPARLMALVQALPELDAHYTPLMKKARREQQWPIDLARRLGGDVPLALQREAGETAVYLARAKRACMLLDWIEGLSIEDMERRYTVTPYIPVAHGDIRGLAEATRYHLGSAYEIATLAVPAAAPDAAAMEGLMRQIEAGIPAEAVGLLDLRVMLSRGEYLALAAAGVQTADTLWSLPLDRLEDLLGSARAQALAAVRPGPSSAPVGERLSAA